MKEFERLDNKWAALRNRLTEVRCDFDFASAKVIENMLDDISKRMNYLRKLYNIQEEKVYFLCV